MGTIVIPINPPTITGWQISVGTPSDVVDAMNTVLPLGYKAAISTYIQPNSDPPTLIWTLTLSRAGYADVTAHNTNWIVCDGTNVTILTDTEFNATYTPVAAGS
jgi:hypothetical protein